MTYLPATSVRGDSTPRGPLRWERAAVNALRNPGTKAADLYFSRYAVAKEIADAARIINDSDVQYEFLTTDWSVRPHGSARKRAYVTCSVFCTIMQVTLDYGTVHQPTIANVFKSPGGQRPRVQRLDTRTLTRDVRCQVCGTQVKKSS